MTLHPKQRTRNVLSQVHRVKQYGGRFITLLNDISLTDKGLYTSLLGVDFGSLDFVGCR